MNKHSVSFFGKLGLGKLLLVVAIVAGIVFGVKYFLNNTSIGQLIRPNVEWMQEHKETTHQIHDQLADQWSDDYQTLQSEQQSVKDSYNQKKAEMEQKKADFSANQSSSTYDDLADMQNQLDNFVAEYYGE